MLISDKLGLRIVMDDGLDRGPKKGDPGDQEVEVVADCCEQGVCGVAGLLIQKITIDAMMMADINV